MSVASNNVVVGRTLGNGPAPLLARLRDPNTGNLITQAGISSIAYKVQDLTAGTSPGSGTLAKTSVVFDTLQADALWTQDSASSLGSDGSYGYNFKWVAPRSLFLFTPAADALGNAKPRLFLVTITFTPVSGESFPVAFQFSAAGTYV